MTAAGWTAVAVAGGLGSWLRAFVTARALAAGRPAGHATLVVNLAGTAVLALLVARGTTGTPLAVLGGGFCGGLTTFSSWVVDAALTERAGRLTQRPKSPIRSYGRFSSVRLLGTAPTLVQLTAVLAVGVAVALLLGA